MSHIIADREFVPAYLDEARGRTVVSVVSASVFSFGHLGSMLYYGFDVVFIINVALLGVVLYLLTKQFESFRAAPGFFFA